jgi:hypothetical protein
VLSFTTAKSLKLGANSTTRPLGSEDRDRTI